MCLFGIYMIMNEVYYLFIKFINIEKIENSVEIFIERKYLKR